MSASALLLRSLALASFIAAGSAHATLVEYTDLASFNGAATASIVEDFESVSPKNAPLGSLSHNGISYTPYAGVPSYNIWVAGPGYNNFGTPTTTSSILTANGDEDWLMSFAGTAAIGFDTYLNKYGPATIEVFGASGSLGSYTYNQDPATIGFFGVTSDDEAITGIRWTTVLGGQINTGIDNIRMGALNAGDPEAVPEPSALALMSLGLIAAGFAGRRRLAGKR